MRQLRQFLHRHQDHRWMALFKKLLRFLMGGGLIWGLRAVLTTVLTEYFAMDAVIAYRIGLGISFVLYFIMNLFFIFQVRDRISWRLAKYALVSMTFLSLDGMLMQWLHRGWGWHYFLALSTSTAVLLMLKFVIYNGLVFQPSKPKPDNPPNQ